MTKKYTVHMDDGTKRSIEADCALDAVFVAQRWASTQLHAVKVEWLDDNMRYAQKVAARDYRDGILPYYLGPVTKNQVFDILPSACTNCGFEGIEVEEISCVPQTFVTGCSDCADVDYYNYEIGKTAGESIDRWNAEQTSLAHERRVEAADVERDHRQGR